ncbi:MAG: DNA-directed RNA polymerase subunit H [Candidatus Diapherotrites archaeon]|nr:DNA-directed RNA polymerase subunit H [Candidatus Diapherotrites archaeon]
MLKSLSEHHLVPQHELLSHEEAKTLLSQFGLEMDKLPQISQEDPVTVELGGKVGDIIRIIRISPVAGESIYYRRVM